MDTDAPRAPRWRLPVILLCCLLAALALPIALVNAIAPAGTGTPPSGRSAVIPLPDGTEATLGDLLDGKVAPSTAPARVVEVPRKDGTTVTHTFPPPARDDLFTVGRHNAWTGNVDAAIACLTHVPSTHPRWADAQRILGWEVYTNRLGQPSRGVAYVNASLAADPFEGNAWQDAVRVYLQSMGIPAR